MWWLAQAAPSGADLAQYGVLGIAVSALSVFARQAYNRERDRADRLEAELSASRARELAMAEKMGTDVTTVLLQATQAMMGIKAASRRREG